jgi:hypothetical protein
MKGNLKSEKTWKIQKKSKLNSEKDMKKDWRNPSCKVIRYGKYRRK